MARPPVAARSQDLIWCEGAIYNLGVTEALLAWRPFLSPTGTVAFTEPVWLVDRPPREIVDWWSAEYPAVSDRGGVEARIAAASHRVLSSFVLPASAWWDEYYRPMQDRIDQLRARMPHDPVVEGVASEAEAEIDLFRRYADCYSYEFFVVEPAS